MYSSEIQASLVQCHACTSCHDSGMQDLKAALECVHTLEARSPHAIARKVVDNSCINTLHALKSAKRFVEQLAALYAPFVGETAKAMFVCLGS